MKYIVICGQEYDMCWVSDIITPDKLDDYIQYDIKKYETDNPGTKVLDFIKKDKEVCYNINYGKKYNNNVSVGGGFNYDLLEVDKFEKRK